jgi:hypothetical protein
MRLRRVESAHALPSKLFLRFIGKVSHREPPDVLKTLYYRPEVFGQAFSDSVHDALRGPSEWSRCERELFAAYTSRLNQCLF